MKKDKVGTVMGEFKRGELKSSSGQKVTNPKQAVAIAMSEAGMSKPKKESAMKGESKIQKKAKETAKMPKMAMGGKAYKKGGAVDGCAIKGKTKGTQIAMKKGGKCK